jgi:hypothetical protein
MPDLGFDGMVKVSWVPTISNIAAPTAVELNAGTSLEGVLVADGLTISSETGEVDNSKMNSIANTVIVGRGTWTLSIKYVRGDAANTAAVAVEAAMAPKANGYLVVRRDLSVTSVPTWVAAQKVEVYPGQIGYANPDSPEADTLQAVEVPIKSTGTPRDITNRATVA